MLGSVNSKYAGYASIPVPRFMIWMNNTFVIQELQGAARYMSMLELQKQPWIWTDNDTRLKKQFPKSKYFNPWNFSYKGSSGEYWPVIEYIGIKMAALHSSTMFRLGFVYDNIKSLYNADSHTGLGVKLHDAGISKNSGEMWWESTKQFHKALLFVEVPMDPSRRYIINVNGIYKTYDGKDFINL